MKRTMLLVCVRANRTAERYGGLRRKKEKKRRSIKKEKKRKCFVRYATTDLFSLSLSLLHRKKTGVAGGRCLSVYTQKECSSLIDILSRYLFYLDRSSEIWLKKKRTFISGLKWSQLTSITSEYSEENLIIKYMRKEFELIIEKQYGKHRLKKNVNLYFLYLHKLILIATRYRERKRENWLGFNRYSFIHISVHDYYEVLTYTLEYQPRGSVKADYYSYVYIRCYCSFISSLRVHILSH